MPKLPSLHHLWNSVITVIKRFPVELLFAITGAVAGTVLVEVQSQQPAVESWCTRIIMIANLGLVLSLSATLLSESRHFSPAKKAMLRLAAMAIAMGLLFLINPAKQHTDYIRFFLFSLAFHLLVSFVAFNQKAGLNGFWQFNKTLFLRILAGGLYAAVLFAGLSAAIGSMNFLFGFNFEWDTFVILWVWIVGLFLTVFFLAGVPSDFAALETDKSYPKGLKVFTQYVLIPLATVYVVILLAYELKILIQWNLPKGLVSNLILGYAVFGILSLLLVFPIRNEEENKWIRTYSRNFYLLLLPLIVLLIVAVFFRVLPYGITVPRYFLLVLAGWLTFITFYFLFSKEHNIRIIPVSLAIFTLSTVYGPQSAFSIAESSQLHTIKSLFKKYGAFDGKYLKPLNPDKIDSAGKERIGNVADYLVKEFGLESLQGVMKPDLKKISDSLLASEQHQKGRWYGQHYQERLWLEKYLHIDSFFADGKAMIASSYHVISDKSPISVKGYRYMLDLNFRDTMQTYLLAGRNISILTDSRESNIRILAEGRTTDIKLSAMLDTLERRKKAPSIAMEENTPLPRQLLKASDTDGKFKVYFNTINFERMRDGKKITFANGQLLIK